MRPRILIVDDEADFIDTCTRLLGRVGFDCITANDALRAIVLIDSTNSQLVVTDLNLPVGDGFEVLRHAMAHVPPLPVIIVTAYHTPEVARRARTGGASDYFPKPFANDDLVTAVRRAVGSS